MSTRVDVSLATDASLGIGILSTAVYAILIFKPLRPCMVSGTTVVGKAVSQLWQQIRLYHISCLWRQRRGNVLSTLLCLSLSEYPLFFVLCASLAAPTPVLSA
jgi:hypothetical protein